MINLMDKMDIESFDRELFGFGKKYESTLAVTNYRSYFKDGGIITGINRLMAVWEVMETQFSGMSAEKAEEEYKKLIVGITSLKKNINNGLKKVPLRVVKGDSLIVDDSKYEDLNKYIKQVREANNNGLKKRTKDGSIFNKLISLNNDVFNTIMSLRTALRSGIKEVKDK